MKGRKGKEKKRDHVVPLSGRAIDILKALPRENDLIFPGAKKGRPLSDASLNAVLRRMGYPIGKVTTHGFRSSFRDWGGDMTAYPNEMLELALAHEVSDATEAAYRRSDMLEKRRRLMTDWEEFCAAPTGAADNVVSIRNAAAP